MLPPDVVGMMAAYSAGDSAFLGAYTPGKRPPTYNTTRGEYLGGVTLQMVRTAPQAKNGGIGGQEDKGGRGNRTT